MAQIGLKSFLYGELDESKKTYTAPAKLAGAIEIKESLTTNDAKLHADDTLVESDDSVAGGTLTLGIDDDDDTIFCPLLGKQSESITPTSGEAVTGYISTTEDTAKFVGFGYITKKTGSKYKVYFYPKVKFKPYSIDGKTKGEKLEYATPSIEGDLFPLDNVYRKEVTVDNLTLAVDLLKKYFTQGE